MIACSCGADTRVTETRATPAGARRRRACVRCDEKFTTYEVRVPARFGNSISGRGHLVIVGEADVNRLRAALGKMLESIEVPTGLTPLLSTKDPTADLRAVLTARPRSNQVRPTIDPITENEKETTE